MVVPSLGIIVGVIFLIVGVVYIAWIVRDH